MGSELPIPKGHGVVKVAHNLRIHITDPRMWGQSPGTDFWLIGHNSNLIEAATGDLDEYGWATTGFSILASSGADFISADGVGTLGGINFDAASDLLRSPIIFGDYSHALMVQSILGRLPVSLNMEVYARFAANNNETATCFGFIEASGSPVTANDAMATIFVDGTDFGLRSGAATDTGDTADTAAHLFKIRCLGTTAEWFIDGTSQGTIALQDDLWPVAWGAGTVSGGSNDPVISFIHCWYE